MYPNIVTFTPGRDKRPDNAGDTLGYLTYRFPHGTEKTAVCVNTRGCPAKAREEYRTLQSNAQRAAMR